MTAPLTVSPETINNMNLDEVTTLLREIEDARLVIDKTSLTNLVIRQNLLLSSENSVDLSTTSLANAINSLGISTSTISQVGAVDIIWTGSGTVIPTMNLPFNTLTITIPEDYANSDTITVHLDPTIRNGLLSISNKSQNQQSIVLTSGLDSFIIGSVLVGSSWELTDTNYIGSAGNPQTIQTILINSVSNIIIASGTPSVSTLPPPTDTITSVSFVEDHNNTGTLIWLSGYPYTYDTGTNVAGSMTMKVGLPSSAKSGMGFRSNDFTFTTMSTSNGVSNAIVWPTISDNDITNGYTLVPLIPSGGNDFYTDLSRMSPSSNNPVTFTGTIALTNVSGNGPSSTQFSELLEFGTPRTSLSTPTSLVFADDSSATGTLHPHFSDSTYNYNVAIGIPSGIVAGDTLQVTVSVANHGSLFNGLTSPITHVVSALEVTNSTANISISTASTSNGTVISGNVAFVGSGLTSSSISFNETVSLT